MFVLVLVSSALSEARTEVYYAGFSFVSEHGQVANQFPYTHALSRESIDGIPLLDAELSSRLRSLPLDNIDLKMSSMANLKRGSKIVLTLAFDRELALVEPVGGLHKLLVELSASALYFDFETMSIIGMVPFSVQYIDSKESDYIAEEIASVIRSLLQGELVVDLFGEFSNYLRTAEVQSKYRNRLQVAHVDVGEAAQSYLPEWLSGPGATQTFVAQSFSRALARNQNLSLLPYTKGHAIGNKMSTRFSDGSVYQLQVPEADYEVHLNLRGFKKVQYAETSAGASWIYGAYTGVKVLEPLSGKIYTDLLLKNGATKLIPVSQLEVADWPPFEESLLVSFDKLSRALDNPDKRWAKKHTGDRQNVKQLEQFKKVIEQCR